MRTLQRGLEPIVQPIDDWYRSWKLGLLFECAVGAGRLMVCSVDLDSGRAGASSLKASLVRYMAGDAFAPKVQVTSDMLAAAFGANADAADRPQAPAQTSPDLDDPGALRRSAPRR